MYKTMTVTYGPYYISTNSPTSNDVTCGQSKTIKTYLYAVPNENIKLVTYSNIAQQEYAIFYVDFNGTTANIFILYNGVKYYVNRGNLKYNTANVSSGINVYNDWNILLNGSGTNVEPQSSMNGVTTAYIRLDQSLGLNQYWLNYTKNAFGNFENNLQLFVDDIVSNPRETNNGTVVCNYIFNFEQVVISTNSVLEVTDTQPITDLKMKISKSGKKIAIQALRSNCVIDNNSIKCTPKSDILLSVVGRKSTLEPGFDHSYRVKCNVNTGIIDKKSAQTNSKLSIYNINDNYIIVKYCGKYFLLTNEINPSCRKMEHMSKVLNNFINERQ